MAPYEHDDAHYSVDNIAAFRVTIDILPREGYRPLGQIESRIEMGESVTVYGPKRETDAEYESAHADRITMAYGPKGMRVALLAGIGNAMETTLGAIRAMAEREESAQADAVLASFTAAMREAASDLDADSDLTVDDERGDEGF